MNKLNQFIIDSLVVQVLSFYEGVTFLAPSHLSQAERLTEQVERLEAIQKETSNGFRGASIAYLTDLYIEETGRMPNNSTLNRLGDVMDADFIFAVQKPNVEYPSLTERMMKRDWAYEASEVHGQHIAVDGQSYRPPNKYRGKSALD